MKKIIMSGNTGPRVRSDCELRLELRSEGGIEINLVSKVKAMFGNSISSLMKKGLSYFGI